jgi:hypothetical protein
MSVSSENERGEIDSSSMGTDECMEDISLLEYLERETHYVIGKLRDGASSPPIVAALVPTRKGWTCRSIYSSVMRHDYMSFESIDDVTAWFPVDLARGWDVSTDREGTAACLATLLEKPEVLDRHDVVVGRPCAPPNVAAEEVLQHLEHGY